MVRLLGIFAKLSIEKLINRLSSSAPQVRVRAAAALGRRGNPEAIPYLVELLRKEKLSESPMSLSSLVAHALTALNWQPTDPSEKARLTVARHDWDVAEALGAAAVFPLVEITEGAGSPTRERALGVLRQICDVKAVEGLTSLLRHRDAGIRMAAVASYFSSHPLAASLGHASQLLPHLEVVFSENASPKDLAAATKALGNSMDRRLAEPLIAAIDLHPQTTDILQALFQTGLEPGRLLEEFRHPGHRRRKVAQGLGKLLKTSMPMIRLSARKVLNEALLSENASIRAAAAYALTLDIPGQSTLDFIEPLYEAINDSDEEIRWSAARILRPVSTPRAFGPFISVMANRANYTEDVVEALVNILKYKAAELSTEDLGLAASLKDGSILRWRFYCRNDLEGYEWQAEPFAPREIRMKAMDELTRRGSLVGQRVFFDIARLQSDEVIRSKALKMITDQHLLDEIAVWLDPRITETSSDRSLLESVALTAHDWKVRRAAARKVTDQQVLTIIAKTDQSVCVREAAVNKLTDQGVLAEIAKSDENDYVREAAVRKLSDQRVLAEIAQAPRKALSILKKGESLDLVNYTGSSCGAAVERLTDMKLITEIAKQGKDVMARAAAVKRLTDQRQLAEIARNDPSDLVRMEALRKLSDPKIRTDIEKALLQKILEKPKR